MIPGNAPKCPSCGTDGCQRRRFKHPILAGTLIFVGWLIASVAVVYPVAQVLRSTVRPDHVWLALGPTILLVMIGLARLVAILFEERFQCPACHQRFRFTDLD